MISLEKDTLNKGHPLNRGHFPGSQMLTVIYIANTFVTFNEGNLSIEDKMASPTMSLVRRFSCGLSHMWWLLLSRGHC